MKKSILISLAVALVLGLLIFYLTTNILHNNSDFSSKVQSQSEQTTSKDSKKADKTFSSEDGSVQLTASEEWKTKNNLNEQAILQIANTAKDKYIIVIDDSKTDFADNTTFSDYATLVLNRMKKTIENVSISEPTKVTINNYPGRQYYLKGEVDKIKVTYLVTLIDTPKIFYQVVAWSLQSKFDNNKEEFKSITSTFQSFGNKGSKDNKSNKSS